jgi:3-oxoacyl-[acyl-carrier-protein] synthase-1
MSLVIQSLGAFTSVGGDVAMTMASLLSQFQAFDDLAADAGGAAGEPITGAATPLPARLAGVRRLAALGLLSLQECAAAAPPGPPVPLFVCAPGAGDWDGSSSELLEGVTADAGIAVDLAQSRVFSSGRTGVVDALRAGRELLAARRASAFYLLGVDSLVTGDRPFRLAGAGRILDDDNSDGFVPGEGAAALLLADAGAHGVAALAGLGRGSEPAGGRADRALTGVGLHEAALGAVAEAQLRGADLCAVVHDVSGVQRDFEDLLLARGRPPLDAAGAARLFAPSLSVGEIGAAAGPLALAMLAFFIDKGVLGGPGLCLFHSDGTDRGAAAVAPLPPSKRWSSHG